MDVEIYDEREIDSATLTGEPDAEAMALITELGLTAQLDANGKRQCYPAPTADQAFIMEQLFPAATRLEKYAAGCIPLRVLKEIRSYREEHPNHHLIVRHSAPAQLKDPILIAWTGDLQHEWLVLRSTPGEWPKFRMVARWGDGLEAWDKLMVRAIESATAAFDSALMQIQCAVKAAREGIAAGVKVRTSSLPGYSQPDMSGR